MPELAGTFLGEEVYWIPGFKGLYGVTKSGKVFSAKNTCWLKLRLSNSGYMRISLYTQNGSQRQPYCVHRLVAAAFLGLDLSNPKIQVDHIDTNKLNNCMDNLRLCSAAQNMQWFHGIGDKDTTTHKQCRKCLEIKPRSDFRLNSSNLDLLHSYCTLCNNGTTGKIIKPKDIDTITHKQCRYCLELKPRSEFSLRSSSKDRLQSYCKQCVNMSYQPKGVIK